MAVPGSKHQASAAAISIAAVATLLMIGSSALAAKTDDAIGLYEQNRFAEALRVFQQAYSETMKDSRAAYYFALTLNSTGRTDSAIGVCRHIIAKFPGSEAAAAARAAIKKWNDFNSVADASAKVRAKFQASRMGRPGEIGFGDKDPDKIGILGLKFELILGRRPRIRVVFPDTPAAACLRPQDEIIAVNNVQTAGLTKEEVFDLLVGKPDTAVSIRILRGERSQEVSLVRISAARFSQQHPDIWKQYLSF